MGPRQNDAFVGLNEVESSFLTFFRIPEDDFVAGNVFYWMKASDMVYRC